MKFRWKKTTSNAMATSNVVESSPPTAAVTPTWPASDGPNPSRAHPSALEPPTGHRPSAWWNPTPSSRRSKFEANRRKEEQPRRKKAAPSRSSQSPAVVPPFRSTPTSGIRRGNSSGPPPSSPWADGRLPTPESPPIRGPRNTRFSLRRLFYGNPLLPPPPWGNSPWTSALSSSSSSRSRRGKSNPGPSHQTYDRNGGGGLEEGASRTNATTPSSTRSRHFFPPDSTSERSVTNPSSSSSAGIYGRDWRGGESTSHAHHHPGSSCASSLTGATMAVAGPSSAYYPGGTFVGADGRAMRECSLCLVSLPLEEFPVLRNCPHLFCFDCLQIYVKIELQEGRVNVRCPQCVEPLHPNDIELFIGDRNGNLQHLYEFLMLRRVLVSDPDTRWCPGPNCTFAVIAAGCASCPKITCERPGCGFSFCYHCKAEWHPNQTCDMARAQRQGGHAQPQQQQGGGSLMMNMMNASAFGAAGSSSESRGPQNSSEVKVCPRCDVLIVKMDDGSCNHMTCSVCAAEFCWLCMKEISDLHYLSPSGCTFWGKKPWSRKKKLLWQLGTLVGAPVGIALLAGISIPAMIIGIPVWVGRKLYAQYSKAPIHKRNLIIASGVGASVIVSPVIAALAVSIGVPILLAYVYGVVPISLCRSEGCGVSTNSNGVSIDVDEELNQESDLSHMPYRPMVMDNYSTATGPSANWNPSIGEMSLGRSLSMGSTSHILDHEADRESASNTAVAGTSRTVSLASSSVLMGGVTSFRGVSFSCQRGGSGSGGSSDKSHHHPHNHNHPRTSQSSRGGGLEVGSSEYHHHHHHHHHHHNHNHHGGARKKYSGASSSTDGLSETASLMDPNQDGASTRALAGSILAYKTDTQSVNSFRTGGDPSDILPASGDEISLRSLPLGGGPAPLAHLPRSLSPTASCRSSGHEDNHGHSANSSANQRRSGRRTAANNASVLPLERQLSEDTGSAAALVLALNGADRVRFDDNVSFIDETGSCTLVVNNGPLISNVEEGSSLGMKTTTATTAAGNKSFKGDKPPPQTTPSSSSATPTSTTPNSSVSNISSGTATNLNGSIPLKEETPEELAQVVSPEISRFPSTWSSKWVDQPPLPAPPTGSALNESQSLEQNEQEEREEDEDLQKRSDQNVTRLQIGDTDQ